MNPQLNQGYSIFHEPLWLDVVAPGTWDAVKVESEGRTVAHWPFVKKQRYGMTILTMPPLTQSLGPWVLGADDPSPKARKKAMEWLAEAANQLPPHDVLISSFHPQVREWLPLSWLGFEQKVVYTQVIDFCADLDKLWSGFESHVRNRVRKAQQTLVVKEGLDLTALDVIHRKTFQRRNEELWVPLELLQRIDAAVMSKGRGVNLYAEDAEGRVHAFFYMVEDEGQLRGIVRGADPELLASGANSLLAWEGLRMAHAKGKALNFGGSMLETISAFNRGFGARQVPFHEIRRYSKKARVLKGLAELGGMGWNRF